MSKYHDRCFRRQSAKVAALRDLHRRARSFGYTRSDFQKALSEIFTFPAWFPVWRIEAIRLVATALHDEMFERDLEFVYTLDEKTYSTNHTATHHGKTSDVDAIRLDQEYTKSGFFWKLTGKPYFEEDRCVSQSSGSITLS